MTTRALELTRLALLSALAVLIYVIGSPWLLILIPTCLYLGAVGHMLAVRQSLSDRGLSVTTTEEGKFLS